MLSSKSKAGGTTLDNFLYALCETLNHAGAKNRSPGSVRGESNQRRAGFVFHHLEKPDVR